jgi:hypothetical protein
MHPFTRLELGKELYALARAHMRQLDDMYTSTGHTYERGELEQVALTEMLCQQLGDLIVVGVLEGEVVVS